jgi:hypothetical protein
VFGDVTSWIGLDQKVEVSRLVVTGDGSIGANDFFGLPIWLSESCGN